jgi:serine/threonine protein kinase
MKRTGTIYGEGSYGVVYQVTDSEGKTLAVKCNMVEKAVDYIGTLRELDIITTLHGHPHIVCTEKVYFSNPFVDNYVHTCHKDYKIDDMYFVQEPANGSLDKKLNIDHDDYPFYKRVWMQILCALEFMHSRNIAHHDIKPNNILTYPNGNIKLCDFGLSDHLNIQQYNTGLVTQWYRPPEVAMGYPHSHNVDVWSLGCIMCELFHYRPLLVEVGENNDNELVLKYILKMIPSLDVDKFRIKYKYTNPQKCDYPSFKQLFKNMTENKIKKWDSTPGTFNQFLDLICNMLRYIPEDRYTATQCLDHPFFESYKPYISQLRNHFSISTVHTPFPGICTNWEVTMKIHKCKRRGVVANELFNIYNSRTDKNMTWYNHRILFHSLRYFDIYLNTLSEEIRNKIELTEEELLYNMNIYYLCLHLSIKYFSMMCLRTTFRMLTGNKFDKYYSDNIAWERRFVRDTLQLHLYKPSVYECVPHKMSETDIMELLEAYGKCDSVTDCDVQTWLHKNTKLLK